ncbi:MAG: hypothetical protein ACFFBH_17535 [Promethearchaeota archaeon]
MSEEGIEPKVEKRRSLHERWEWLDQFRGLIIIFLIISVITWPLSGDPSIGSTNPPIGPPLLNHGFKYFNGYPALITIIDIGQQIFMFVLGLGAYLAFTSRREKKGTGAAWKHAAIRIGILYFLAFLDDGLIGGTLFGPDHTWNAVLYYGTLANLAIGTFAAYLAVYLIPKSADKRMYITIAILIIHASLFYLPFLKHHGSSSGWPPDPWNFPWNAINHAAIAIAGTCFCQWYKMDPNDPVVGFKKRILPVATISILAFYCFDWIQPAEHHDATTSLALLAIAASGFLIAIFYGFEKLEFKVPILSEMGRNLLLLFILAFIFDQYVQIFPKPFLIDYPWLTMILIGILPIAIEGGIAVLLAKRNIIIKI